MENKWVIETQGKTRKKTKNKNKRKKIEKKKFLTDEAGIRR